MAILPLINQLWILCWLNGSVKFLKMVQIYWPKRVGPITGESTCAILLRSNLETCGYVAMGRCLIHLCCCGRDYMIISSILSTENP